MNARIGNIVYAPMGWLLALMARMPLAALYPLASALAWLLGSAVRYRRRVVDDNLARCFPDRSDAWREATAKEFYRNFADYFVETVKLGHISDEEMRRRMVMTNVETVDRLLASGKSVVAYFSHCGNWEWATSITLWSREARGENAAVFAQVYRPLKNRWFDRFFLRLRSRFGSVSFPKHTVLRHLIELRRDHRVSITGFMSDQKPSHGDPTLVVELLNRPTAMITGTETLARKLGMAAVYFDMTKTSRGHYRIDIKLITEDAASLPPHELTRRYAALLQTTIERDPAIWLWTHKRWKHPVTLPTPETAPTPDTTDNNSATA